MIKMNRLKKCYDTGANVAIHTQQTKNPRVLKELEDSRFCPPPMLSYYKECDKYIILSLGSINYHIYYKPAKILMPLSNMIRSIQRTHALMMYCGINKPINVHIVMAPYKRYFPHASEIMDTIHINGGFTAPTSNDIFIIRSEEASKVILHEVLHHCREVHNNNWTQYQLDRLYTAFNISKSTSLYPNEAVVELWATVMHSMFIAIDYNVPIDIILSTEVRYSLQQCKRILEIQEDGKWYEKTNAYCYIIFKTILLMNIKTLADKYPYDTEYITQFLIDHKDDVGGLGGLKDRSGEKYAASLRMMKLSDL
jgi:hypothetical protein